MIVTNTTAQDYGFGPLHLLGGVNQQLTVDDTTATSLYLTDDAVADAINNLYISGKITVSSQAQPFPRPTGVPSLLHGDGAPEGLVYAPQGSLYMRRDGTGANNLYAKTTGVTLNTGWESYTTTAVGPGTTYRKTTAKAVTNTVTETDLLNGEISIGASVLGTTGIARLTAWGDWVENSGGASVFPRFKVKLGSGPTTVIDTGTSGAGVVGNSATRFPWRIVIEIQNLGATNSQQVSFSLVLGYAWGTIGSGAFTTGEGVYLGATESGGIAQTVAQGFNTAAIDTTVAMALALSVISPTATATCETKLYGALAEII